MKQIETDPIMLNGMIDCLAVAVENAVFEWGETAESFFDKFIKSKLADSFSKQEPFVTTGCTGEELVAMVNEEITNSPHEVRQSSKATGFSEYYWIGYALALFTAQSGILLEKILTALPLAEWLRMFHLYHEYGDELLLEKLRVVYSCRVSS
jgi:hypothetical protein